MTEELQQEYNRLAEEMREALAAAKFIIPPNIFGKAKDMQLEKEDYRQLGTSLFIEKHYAERRSNGNYEGEISEGQTNFIAILLNERAEAKENLDQFLNDNGIELVADLSSSEASSLIDKLKTLKKK